MFEDTVTPEAQVPAFAGVAFAVKEFAATKLAHKHSSAQCPALFGRAYVEKDHSAGAYESLNI